MTQFFDALSQKKTKLNYRNEVPKVYPNKAPCAETTGGHTWEDENDDLCACSVCGMSVVHVQALRHFKSKEKKSP